MPTRWRRCSIPARYPDAKDRYGLTPLYYASSNGNAAIVRKLLEGGANPNIADKEGDTALMAAARSGNADAIAALLGHDASVNARTSHPADGADVGRSLQSPGRGAGSAGARRGSECEHPNGPGSGAPASPRRGRSRRTAPTGLGIVRGGWPERGAQDATPGAMTALLYAARDGRLDAAKLFVDAKADVNQTEANGVTPLLIAIANAHFDVARFLLDHGAAVNTADWWGRTPLWAAVEVRNLDNQSGNEPDVDRAAALDLFKTLIERGADVNARTKEYTPIRRWVTSLNDISWVDFTGQTPFLRAALSGDITVMRLLLDKGADPNIPTFAGSTALMAAAGVNLGRISRPTPNRRSLDGSGQAVSREGRGRERGQFHGAHGGDGGGQSRLGRHG